MKSINKPENSHESQTKSKIQITLLLLYYLAKKEINSIPTHSKKKRNYPSTSLDTEEVGATGWWMPGHSV